MVHFDGSKLPLEENIKISKKVVVAAKKRGVVVEGEVGRIGTDSSRIYEEKFEIKEGELTNVKDAELYMKKTGVNVLAVSVGTFHGMDMNGISPHIRMDRLREISDKISAVPLVLHGGSGTPENDLREAIKLGIAKININTETRLAFSNTLRKKMEIDKNEIVPYKYLPEAILAVQGVAEKYIGLFGSEGKV
jgi:fructose-bisphosphate aldolase class II